MLLRCAEFAALVVREEYQINEIELCCFFKFKGE